jgi:hypothetical protein
MWRYGIINNLYNGGGCENQFAFEMWATQQSLWNLIYQISSDNSYDSTTKVRDIHYKYCPPYMIRLTITLPLQPRTMAFSCEKYYCWNLLLALLYIFARPTLANSVTTLNHRSVHLSRIAHTCVPARSYLLGCLLTMLILHHSTNVTKR